MAKPTADFIRDAIGQILSDGSYRQAAVKTGDTFRAASGASKAAEHILNAAE